MLGFVAALLLVLPWHLRIAALLVWLVGGYFAIIAIETAYDPFSQHGEILVLQFAAITSMVAIAMLLMVVNKEHLWGGLTLGGALFLLGSYGAMKLSGTQSGTLILQVLPPALLATNMIAMGIRLKKMRRSGKIQTSSPLFVWTKNLLSGIRSKGGDVSSK